MHSFARHQILGLHVDADLHRGPEHAIDRRPQHDQFSNVHRMQELKTVDRSGDHGFSGVPHGCHGRGDVDQMHDDAAEHVAKSVGVVGKSQL